MSSTDHGQNVINKFGTAHCQNFVLCKCRFHAKATKVAAQSWSVPFDQTPQEWTMREDVGLTHPSCICVHLKKVERNVAFPKHCSLSAAHLHSPVTTLRQTDQPMAPFGQHDARLLQHLLLLGNKQDWGHLGSSLTALSE